MLLSLRNLGAYMVIDFNSLENLKELLALLDTLEGWSFSSTVRAVILTFLPSFNALFAESGCLTVLTELWVFLQGGKLVTDNAEYQLFDVYDLLWLHDYRFSFQVLGFFDLRLYVLRSFLMVDVRSNTGGLRTLLSSTLLPFFKELSSDVNLCSS